MSGAVAEIHVQRKETTIDWGGASPDQVTCLRVYSGKKNDLPFLSEYPNVTQLFLRGDFSSIDAVRELRYLSSLTIYPSAAVDCAGLSGLSLRSLTAANYMPENLTALFSDSLRRLELSGLRWVNDLSFLQQAAGLEKLYLNGMPAVEALPDFPPNLYALKLYELHKLSDLSSLSRSAIRYLSASLIADKVSGTRLAELLLSIPRLEKASLRGIDRSGSRRYTVLENQLRRAGREALLGDMNYQVWDAL